MRSARLLGLCLVSALFLTSCGESSKSYPASKAEGVFFSVPKNWNSFSTAALNKYEKKSSSTNADSRQSLVKWQVAYSTDLKIKVSQIFSLKPPSSPLVFARVRDLTASEMNNFSYNSLRNVITPVTQLSEGADLGLDDFKILLDREIVEKGGRGVQTIYTFSLNGAQQTLNQIALMSIDRSTLYIFIVRCTTTCYVKNKKVIEEIVNSYTVQGAK